MVFYVTDTISEYSVINDFGFAWNVKDDFVITIGISISAGDTTLWQDTIPVATKFSDECEEMTIYLVDWLRMIPVPCIWD